MPTNPRSHRQYRKLREQHLRDSPYCVVCIKLDELTEAVEVDHIKPLDEGGQLMDPSNLQSLCKLCHKLKSSKEQIQRFKNPK